MKTVLITLIVLTVIFIIFQSFISMGTTNTEKQPYTVLKTDGALEIRLYPSVTMATIQSTARNYRELSGNGFRKIAGYIFGNNESGEKIAMTTPVHMDFQESGSSMAFVMPSGYDETNLPKPNDPSVKIKKTDVEYAAALRFGGFASDETIARHSKQLSALLEEKGIKPIGHFRFLGYNPPYQLVGRRNEIIVSIEWNQ
jgi:SOUL heme-binding protein